MSKSTKCELNQRVTEVSSLLLEGRTRSYIVQYGSKWKVSDRQIDDYISMASKQIKEVNDTTIQDQLAILVQGLWDVYRTAVKEKNLAEQHKALNSLAKIQGLDQNTVLLKVEARDLESTSDADLLSLLTPKGPEDDT